MRNTTFVVAILILIGFEVYYFKTERWSPVGDEPTQDSKKLSPEEEITSKNLQQVQAQQAAPTKSDVQEQTLTQLYLVESNSKKKDWEVWADSAHKGMGSAVWELDKVKAEFFSENVTYKVNGAKGTVDEAKKDMIIEGDVKLVSSNGYIFFTNKLVYNPTTKSINSRDKVSVEGPNEGHGRLYMEGTGLNVSLVSNLMVLEKDVLGHKPMSQQRAMSIRSQRAEFSGTEQTAIFKNNVVIKVDKMVVKGNFANFQYKNGKLDTLTMDGGIHMQDQNKIGSSGEAIVYFNEDKYVFRKKPFVTQGENELIGDEIVIFNGGQRVQVRNAKAQYQQQSEKAQ